MKQRPFKRCRQQEVFRKRRNGVVILRQLITRRVLAQKHCIVTGWTHVTTASTHTHTGTEGCTAATKKEHRKIKKATRTHTNTHNKKTTSQGKREEERR